MSKICHSWPTPKYGRKACFAEERGQRERRRALDEGGVSQIARDAAGAALSRGHVPGAAARRS